MKQLISTILLASVALGNLWAQVPQPASEQQKPIAITGAVAHLGNGKVIENALVTFDKGKLTLVADARVVRVDLSGHEVIEANGKHLYPGLILANTELGLLEVESVRATRDYSETGDYNPNVRSIIAYNTDSELIPTLRYNGILLAQVTPKGGTISGSSSVVALDGWNWEDAAYAYDEGIHMGWVNTYQRPRWWLGETQIKKNENYEAQVREIEQFFNDAKAYANAGKPKTVNLKMEAMKGLFDGSKTLYIEASYAKDIVSGIQFAQAMGVKKIVLKGGEQAYRVADFLKENAIPVVLANVHRLPSSTDEDIDMPYKLAADLTKAGVMVVIAYDGLQSSRNLPFFAGTAAAYGLDKEQALQLITLNPAKMLGIESRAGSIEVGKDAHLILSSGDLLDMRGNNVEAAFINGKRINLDGKQQMLYQRFKEKFEQE
ncbi:amidohydrolase family protein [Cytophagales bacterium LB-30]|uniref:Amidohydrolase family protein n=1 Tax=Shiella aurantiaca TaxID=3058365 RepID=A0ABT8F1L5_9BACT|nr:amidohydrolase family protein [Shiella aurantiaca]MDN4164189.1 amidohydrolase family protein [Shiella aurantiaca]